MTGEEAWGGELAWGVVVEAAQQAARGDGVEPVGGWSWRGRRRPGECESCGPTLHPDPFPALPACNRRQDCRAAPPTHARKPAGRLTHAYGLVTLNEKVPLAGIIKSDKKARLPAK